MSLTVYGTAASGNCHKVRLALDILGRPYGWHEIDLMRGETRSESFLAMNPTGKAPVLAIDDRTFLALFAYTHRAADGGFDPARYPAVSAWLARCRAVRGVTEMPTPA